MNVVKVEVYFGPSPRDPSRWYAMARPEGEEGRFVEFDPDTDKGARAAHRLRALVAELGPVSGVIALVFSDDLL